MAIVPVPGACTSCGGGGGSAAGTHDVEGAILCDVNAAGEIVGSAYLSYDFDSTTGLPSGAPVLRDIATGAVYVPTGTMQPCGNVTHQVEFLCDIDPLTNATTAIEAVKAIGPNGAVLEVNYFLLDGTPYVPLGTVGRCEPYTNCTPQSDLNLNGDCFTPEVADPIIIGNEGVAADSVINDDPSADPLCGGVWDRPSEASPFTVAETFRNATFDQPGPITQGTAPYAGLTASPGWTGSNVDAPGDGWLQTSDINSFTNGMWQVANPFSTADGMTARVKFASHDGTLTPNGDGYGFFFTDGSIPGQTTAIGGGGGLGHENWQGGYLGIIIDEYGAFTGANRINLVKIGGSAVPPGTGTQAFDSLPLAPKDASAGTTRATPGELFVSLITEGGQTYVSVSILWPGDTDPIVYWNRRNVTADLGVSPATMRMALYGGSGGAYRSEHEWRDAVATAAGSQQWRAFQITTDPVPVCVTSVRVEVCVDQTFTEDTQVTGNGNPEAFLWLVNDATNTVLDKAQRSSQPTQVGTATTLCVDATVPIAQLPNLRIYVGAETRDSNGIYGSSWENMVVTASGLGCPVTPVRTIAISAPCPIDVNIVGGTADGTPAPVTVVNTPSTFEDQPVCITIGGVPRTGFRREVRNADGSVVVTMLGTDGLAVVPDSWVPGACANPVFAGFVCDQVIDPDSVPTSPGTGFVTREPEIQVAVTEGPTGTFTPNGADGASSLIFDTAGPVLADISGVRFSFDAASGNAPSIFGVIPSFVDNLGNGFTMTAPDALAFEAAAGTSSDVGVPSGTSATIVVGTTNVTITFLGPSNSAVTSSNTGNMFAREFDQDGLAAQIQMDFNPPVRSARLDINSVTADGGALAVVQVNPASGINTISTQVKQFRNADGTSFYENLDGTTHAVAGTVGACPTSDVEWIQLCDSTNTGDPQSPTLATPFLRRLSSDADGNVLVADFELDAVTAYVTAGFVGICDGFNSSQEILCDFGNLVLGEPTQFIQEYVYWGSTGQRFILNNRNLQDAQPYLVVGPVGVCQPDADNGRDIEDQILCDNNGPFLRSYQYDGDSGLPSGVPADYTLTGAPYVAIGPVTVCGATDDCGQILGEVCYSGGRLAVVRDCGTGAVTYYDFTGAVVVAPVITVCPNFDNQFQVLCDAGNGGFSFLRQYVTIGGTVSTADLLLDGVTAYVAVGPVTNCGTAAANFVTDEVLCDIPAVGPAVPFIRTYGHLPNGVIVTTNDWTLGGTPYATVGIVGTCPTVQFDVETQILCDNPTGVSFLRRYVYDAETPGVAITTFDTTLNGTTAYVVVGTAGLCAAAVTATLTRDEEVFILCDSTAPTPIRFIRKYNYNGQTGAFIDFTDSTLAGAPFAPVGTVGVCTTAIQSDFDFVVLQVCDSAATPVAFLRRLTFASATGLVTATTDTTYAGAPYVPVGAVGACSTCCPVVLATGCSNVGSGTYTALRLPTGAISLIDSVTGAAITAANVVTCAPANGVLPNIAADHFDVLPGTPYTPAVLPAGRRLTSLTYTVLSGTATVTDATGATVVATIPTGYTGTWSAQDDRETLTGPASIASVGGRVLVLFTTAL